MTTDPTTPSNRRRRPTDRPPRFYVMVGIPGSGKSTYARTNLAHALRISLDDLRLMLSSRTFVARLEPLIVDTGDAVTDAVASYAATRKYDVVHDATNVTVARRAPLIERAKHFGLIPVAVYVEVPLSIALARNNARRFPVPNEAVESFYRRLQVPTLAEGFEEVYVVEADKPNPDEDAIVRVEPATPSSSPEGGEV